jgi:formate hydrogenlyase subunit 6/NADH:ubiquinone oxidoreductase subunit I
MLMGFREGRQPRVNPEACLGAHPLAISCTACKSACPTGAIRISASGASINDACIGCGRCAAQCPTAALDAGANGVARRAHDGPQIEIRVACERVANCFSPQRNVAVRCLGSVSVADWLELIHRGGGAPIEIVDPGVCSACPAGGTPSPWAASLERLSAHLSSAGLPLQLAPTVVRLPAGEAAVEPDRSRRNFLRRLSPFREDVPEGKPPQGTIIKRSALNVVREATAIDALRQVMATDGSGGAMPIAVVSADCDGCGICAAVCPTPALQIASADEYGRQLTFTGSQCVACGRCSELCPRDALVIHPQGGPSGTVCLKDFALTLCRCCDEPFVSSSSTSLCPTCQRSEDLVGAGFFGTGASSSARVLLGAMIHEGVNDP